MYEGGKDKFYFLFYTFLYCLYLLQWAHATVIFKRKIKMFIKQLTLATWAQQRNFRCGTYLFQRLLLSSKVSQLLLQGRHPEFQLSPALLFTLEFGLCLLRGFLELWDMTAQRLGCRTRAAVGCMASQHRLQSCILSSPNPTTWASSTHFFQHHLTDQQQVYQAINWLPHPSIFISAPTCHLRHIQNGREMFQGVRDHLRNYHSHNSISVIISTHWTQHIEIFV